MRFQGGKYPGDLGGHDGVKRLCTTGGTVLGVIRCNSLRIM